MKLQLSKLYAAGHDFLYFFKKLPSASVLSALCDRRRGVGAEGCIFCADENELQISYFESSGTETTPPPAALLCAAKQLYDTGKCNTTEFCISHLGGSQRLRVENCGGVAWGITRDFGYPILDCPSIPCNLSGLVRAQPMRFENIVCPVTILSFGEAYAFLHLSDQVPVPDPTPLYALFPNGVVPVTLASHTSDVLSVSSLSVCKEDAALAAATAVVATINGMSLFSKCVRVICADTTYRCMVTPDLHTYVTTEVERPLCGSFEFDAGDIPPISH